MTVTDFIFLELRLLHTFSSSLLHIERVAVFLFVIVYATAKTVYRKRGREGKSSELSANMHFSYIDNSLALWSSGRCKISTRKVRHISHYCNPILELISLITSWMNCLSLAVSLHSVCAWLVCNQKLIFVVSFSKHIQRKMHIFCEAALRTKFAHC